MYASNDYGDALCAVFGGNGICPVGGGRHRRDPDKIGIAETEFTEIFIEDLYAPSGRCQRGDNTQSERHLFGLPAEEIPLPVSVGRVDKDESSLPGNHGAKVGKSWVGGFEKVF
jgi:hypothetical protein